MSKKEILTIIISISSLFIVLTIWTLWMFNKRVTTDEEILTFGNRTVGFYERSGYNTMSPYQYYVFNVKGTNHECVSHLKIVTHNDFKLLEIPVLIGYLKNDPSQNQLITDEVFNYKGYRIQYKKSNASLKMYLLSKPYY